MIVGDFATFAEAETVAGTIGQAFPGSQVEVVDSSSAPLAIRPGVFGALLHLAARRRSHRRHRAFPRPGARVRCQQLDRDAVSGVVAMRMTTVACSLALTMALGACAGDEGGSVRAR